MWRHVRHLNLIDKNPQIITKEDKEFLDKRNYKGINFPVSQKDYGKTEIQKAYALKFFAMKIK